MKKQKKEIVMPMRFSNDEAKMLRELSQRLQRTQADTVRLLIRGASLAIKEIDEEQLAQNKGKTIKH